MASRPLAFGGEPELAAGTYALFDLIPHPTWVANIAGEAVYLNRRWYEYTGSTPEQMEGSGWQSVIAPEELPGVLERWRAALASGEPFEMTYRLRRQDGVFRWFSTRAVPLHDSAGRIVRWVGVNTDIDAQVQLQQLQRRSVEEQRHAWEERFHTLVDAVTDYAIFMLDATGRVATWNAGARAINGYEAGEIVGRHFSVFYAAEDRAAGKPERVLETVRREGRFEEESWRVRKDGSRFSASVVITALRDRTGEITGFAKVTRDLTARRAAEENERKLVREQLARAATEDERRRLLTLLEQVPAVVNFLRGPDLVFEFVHPKAVRAMGGRHVLGKPLLEALPELRTQAYAERVRRVYDTGQPFVEQAAPRELDVEGQRSETFWDAVYLPVRDAEGAIEGVMTFELDVTGPVRARQEMQRVDHAKDEFLATMSHELRTPLNAIQGWATLLRRKPREEAKLDRGLEAIERNARAQTRLVNDLLDVSRIISGKLDLRLQKTLVGPVVQAAADVVRPAADAKGVRLVVDVDPEIGETMGDPDRLQQVVWNLLSNAVRFTPRGGRVTVTADRASSGIVVRVQDTGIGIAPDRLPHVFERFMQVDSSVSRAHGGLGLGLSIVRHLVEAHGGWVDAESEGLGHGATFTVTLPIAAGATAGPERGRNEALTKAEGAALGVYADLAGVRVLVVDDEPDSVEVVRLVLAAAGADVTTAASAREGFDRLDAQGPFDLVISDIGMPEIDGYAFLRTVRSRAVGGDVPAIALTAYARAQDVELARSAGYQEHLAKPVDAGRLVTAVKAWSRSCAHAGA